MEERDDDVEPQNMWYPDAASVHPARSPQSYHDAKSGRSPPHPQRDERPLPSRHSSLPGALFAPRSGSIFGPARSPSSSAREDHERTSLVNVSHRSRYHAGTAGPMAREPFSTLLTDPRPNNRRGEDEVRSTADRRRIPQAEKDADDPTTPPSTSTPGSSRPEPAPLAALSRLFSVQTSISPDSSRSSSYTRPSRSSTGVHGVDTATLSGHLYARGLLEGRHSDITVNAFGQHYKLHRIILDRAPFFRSALNPPWVESNAKETTLYPEEIDPAITQASFELAVKRLYGYSNLNEEENSAVGLFATGCWLEMPDLVDSSVQSILRQMTPKTLSPLVRLVTRSEYGRAGDKILASAKAMLCRDGWRMSLRNWDDIPGDIVREIVGGDGFFIDGEWDRWLLAKRILDRRLKLQAIGAGLTEPDMRNKVRKAPNSLKIVAARIDAVHRRNINGMEHEMPDNLQKWISLYTHPDVEPILVLLDEGIHYLHLEFEQLQLIRTTKDILGLPITPDKVISNALWQQMELRQRVVNSCETSLELDISMSGSDVSASQTTIEANSHPNKNTVTPAAAPPSSKDKHQGPDMESQEEVDEEVDEGSRYGNGTPRKFWIPTSDCNIVIGGNADPFITTSNKAVLRQRASRLGSQSQLDDEQWASDFSATVSQLMPMPGAGSAGNGEGGACVSDVRYSDFPPFRFAAEFPNPRALKDKKRVYSRTVFYAGSLWNIYIQKVTNSRSKQLGVYLHRAKERQTDEEATCTASLAQGNVDERIGQLEREIMLRSERHERRRRRHTTTDSNVLESDTAESSGSAGTDATVVGAATGTRRGLEERSSVARSFLSRSSTAGSRKSAQTDVTAYTVWSSSTYTDDVDAVPTPDSETDDEDDANPETDRLVAAATLQRRVPTLPPYVDARPTIKTYFKIYSPSRGGRMLSVYESAPDRFNFSQSWGWKSSSLMLDEELLGDDEVDGPRNGDGGEAFASSTAGHDSFEDGGVARLAVKGKGDGKLRFMVVIGNI